MPIVQCTMYNVQCTYTIDFVLSKIAIPWAWKGGRPQIRCPNRKWVLRKISQISFEFYLFHFNFPTIMLLCNSWLKCQFEWRTLHIKKTNEKFFMDCIFSLFHMPKIVFTILGKNKTLRLKDGWERMMKIYTKVSFTHR